MVYNGSLPEKARLKLNHPGPAQAGLSFGTNMNYKELFATLEAVANEKGLPMPLVYGVLQAALGSVFRKNLGEDAAIEVTVHKDAIEAYRVWKIVADDQRLDNPAREMRWMDAKDDWPGCEVGQERRIALAEPVWSRVAAQAFRQTLIQGIREAERERTRQDWQNRVGELLVATVKRWEKGHLHLDINGYEAILQRDQQLPGERPRVGQRLMVLLTGLNPMARGPVLQTSRSNEGLLLALLEREVPEIHAGTVRVRGCVREKGARTKVALESLASNVDPIAACVGMRGVRIQAVTNELNGERLDLLTWSDSAAELAVRALAPARVIRVVQDEAQRRMFVAVEAEDVGLALGRGGQNVRVAARLVDWDLDVMTADALDQLLADEINMQAKALEESLDIDADMARVLVEEGFVSLDVVAYCQAEELLQVHGIDEDIAAELQHRARAALVNEPGAEDGWGQLPLQIQEALRARGVDSWESLADCSVDELDGIEGLSEADAGDLIMKARAAWFETEQA